MKNVTLTIKLHRLFKSLAAGCIILAFAVTGSAFTTLRISKKEALIGKTFLGKTNSKQLFNSCNHFDPTKTYVTELNLQAVSFVQKYIQDEEENLEQMKVWGKPYFDMYDEVLEQYGVPKELKYLSVIESSLVHDIKSPVGAAGPWQIMASEARRVGLKVNGKTDERMSFKKSTYAAAKILQELHDMFGDWLLVVAAYNCGEVRMRQAMKKSGSNDFWTLQKYLPAQTRAHVKRFIGTQYIFEGDGGLTTMTASRIFTQAVSNRS